MKITNFNELIKHQIADLYDAEKQLTEALPKMAKAATNPQLKTGFEKHLNQTKEQVTRLEEAAKACNLEIEDVVCKGMKGLIYEGKEVLESIDSDALLDAVLIGAAQKVEHYEISAYGTLITHLEEAAFTEAAEILEETLSEEEETNEKLTEIAKEVNSQALEA